MLLLGVAVNLPRDPWMDGCFLAMEVPAGRMARGESRRQWFRFMCVQFLLVYTRGSVCFGV